MSGIGFDPTETVHVYFETTDLTQTTTDDAGSFEVTIRIPRSALPGIRRIAAAGEASRRGARHRFIVNTNWKQFGFVHEGSRYNPYENVLGTGNVAFLKRAWFFTTGGPVSSSPAVVNGVVYIGSNDGNAYALEASDGSPLWSFPTGAAGRSSPAVADGVVYVGSSDHLYALDATDGSLIWSFRGTASSPVVADGVVYFGSGDHLYALDAGDGNERWSVLLSGSVSTPVVEKGVVFVANGIDKIYAINAADGTEKWSYQREDVLWPSMGSSPTVADGIVYATVNDYGDPWCVCPQGFVFALEAADGGELWSSQGLSDAIGSSPAVANGTVYISVYYYALQSGGHVDALNAADGSLKWSAWTDTSYSSPAVANGVVYSGAYENIFAFRAANGNLDWSFPMHGEVFSSPAVTNGRLYVGTGEGHVGSFKLRPPPPHTGQFLMYSQKADISYKRLSRTISVPIDGATMSFWTWYETEPNWDFLFVEARTAGGDDWTTLADENGNTSEETGDSCANGWRDLHPHLDHYQAFDGQGTCTPAGTTGEWNAASGNSNGWLQWRVDLSRWAGRDVELSLAYASDWSVQGHGVLIDDIEVSTGEGNTSFENDGDPRDGWEVTGPPPGSAPNLNNFERAR